MKRTIVILAAAAALAVSCQREEAMSPDSGASYSFNLNITGGGFSNGTRADATVGWTVGENVFLFFQPEGEGVLDRCLTLTYDGSSFHQSGSYIPYGKLGTGGKLSAVYVPYLKGGVRPVFSEGCWSIDGGDVYYSCASGVAYTVSGQQVSATVAMSIPDGYMQFAVPATKAADGDMMSCNLVDAYDCVTLGADLQFTETPVEGKKMTGHKDGGNVFFWGKMNGTEADECELILASSVTGTDLVKKVDLHETAVAKNKAYSTDFYVLPEGALPGLFSISPTEKVHFSKGNLYCKRSGSEGAYSYTFDMEEKQYEFHIRYIIEDELALFNAKFPDEGDDDIIYIDGDSPQLAAIPGLKREDNISGLFQWVSKNAVAQYPPYDPFWQGHLSWLPEVTYANPYLFNDEFKSFGAFSNVGYNDLGSDLNGKMTDVVDFGEAYGDGKTWFTLSRDEWQYLLGVTLSTYSETNNEWVEKEPAICRSNASELFSWPVTVNGVIGLLIAPDDWNYTEKPITGVGAKTAYNDEDWTAAEGSGLVFLPNVSGAVCEGLSYHTKWPFDDFDFYNVQNHSPKIGFDCSYWSRSAFDKNIPPMEESYLWYYELAPTSGDMAFGISIYQEFWYTYDEDSGEEGFQYVKSVNVGPNRRHSLNPVRLVCR